VSDVLDRPQVLAAASSPTRTGPAAPLWLRGVFAATWAIVVGVASLIVLALVVWAADSRSVANAAEAMRLAGQVWLLAQRTPLQVSGGALTLPPLGLTVVLGMLVARATALVARGTRCTDARELGVVVASVAVPYAVLATVLAAVTPSSSIRPTVGAAFVCAALVGGGSATIGAVRATGLARPMWRKLPGELRTALDAAGVAAAALVGAAMILLAASLLIHSRDVWAVLRSYDGTPGEISMAVLSLLLVPNAILFALGYLVGPGFSIGAGTSVGLAGAHVGPMPALPLLAAVPQGRAPWPVDVFCIAAVMLAGGLAGWRVARRPTLSNGNRVRCALLAAAALGVGAALLVAVAGGPSGPGLLRAVGPSPWQVGLTVAAEMGALVVIAAVVCSWIRSSHATVSLEDRRPDDSAATI
jgi:hypothetical protein